MQGLDPAALWDHRKEIFPAYQWDEPDNLEEPIKATMPAKLNRQIGGENTTWIYGLTLFEQLAWYWNTLRWSRRPGVGITWLELAIDFWMCTGDLPGRNNDTNPKEEVAPTAAARKFSAMSRRLRQMMKAPLGNCDTAAGIVSLVPLGFSTMYGFVGRPLLRRAEYVQQVLINMVGKTSMLTLKNAVSELTLQVTRMPLPLWQPITMAAGHH